MRPGKGVWTVVVVILLLTCAHRARAWEKEGQVPATELTFSGFEVTREGVSVRLTNTSHTAVKISARVAFFDNRGNSVGYAIFGLREIPGGAYANIAENHLTGNWRSCRDAYRMEWQPMTYELVY